MVNEIAYSQLFFFLLVMGNHTIAAKAFPSVLIYFYMVTFVVQTLAHILQSSKIKLVIQIVQFVICFILFILLMADPWCGYFIYR